MQLVRTVQVPDPLDDDAVGSQQRQPQLEFREAGRFHVVETDPVP